MNTQSDSDIERLRFWFAKCARIPIAWNEVHEILERLEREQETVRELAKELRLIAGMVDAPTERLAVDLYLQARVMAKEVLKKVP